MKRKTMKTRKSEMPHDQIEILNSQQTWLKYKKVIQFITARLKYIK